MSLLSKHRLWLTVNGICSIPEISNREIMIYTLNSLNNNIYKIRNIQIPELIYIDNSINDQLLTELYLKYISAIKETEDRLADMIINDLLIQYTPVITQSFSYTLMYGGGDGPPKRKPQDNPPKRKPQEKPPELVSELQESKSEIAPGSHPSPETAYRENIRRQPGPIKRLTNFIGRTMFSSGAADTNAEPVKKTRFDEQADKPPGKVYKTHTVAPPGGLRDKSSTSGSNNPPPPPRVWNPSEVSYSGYESD